jgi:phosphoribosyl 1,2-cyclic phosphodiesterase
MTTTTVRFHGVRGSIPSPGPRTARVGGNTSCVEVRRGELRLVLDAGTGLRRLGLAAGTAPVRAHLLFSHLHWDHIQGIPFFGPLFDRRSEVAMIGPAGLQAALATQMSRPTFPVTTEMLPAAIRHTEIRPGARFTVGDLDVTTAPLNHPGGAIGYRLAWDGGALVYACDVEPRAGGHDPALVDLARGADLLIIDAQYLPEEYPAKVGWGHGTYEDAAEVAAAAEVGELVLTHHDPGRDDLAVARLERRARHEFARTRCAREGLVLEVAHGAAPTSAARSRPATATAARRRSSSASAATRSRGSWDRATDAHGLRPTTGDKNEVPAQACFHHGGTETRRSSGWVARTRAGRTTPASAPPSPTHSVPPRLRGEEPAPQSAGGWHWSGRAERARRAQRGP